MSSEIGEEVRRSSLNIVDARNVFHGSPENYQKYLEFVELFKKHVDTKYTFLELPRQQMYLHALQQAKILLRDVGYNWEEAPQYLFSFLARSFSLLGSLATQFLFIHQSASTLSCASQPSKA